MPFLVHPPHTPRPWRPQRDLTIPWSDTPSPSRIFRLIAVTPGARGAFCSGDLKLPSPPPLPRSDEANYVTPTRAGQTQPLAEAGFETPSLGA